MNYKETPSDKINQEGGPANQDRREFLKTGTIFTAGTLFGIISQEMMSQLRHKSEQIDSRDNKAIEEISKKYDVSLNWLKATILSLRDNPNMKEAIYTTHQWVVICSLSDNEHLRIDILKNQGQQKLKKINPTAKVI